MKLNVVNVIIYRRRSMPDVIVIETEVPSMNKTTKIEFNLPEGKGLGYLQEHFSKGELGSFDLSVRPFQS